MKQRKLKGNNFDNLIVDVGKLYQDHPLQSFGGSEKKRLRTIYRNPLPKDLRNAMWYIFHRIQLDQDWFFEFKKYWKDILGGITLWGPEDFYFLRNLYRLKFSAALNSSKGSASHLNAWQKPEIIYQLLDMVYRDSLFNQQNVINLFKKHRRSKNPNVFEFGCGIGPVAASLMDFENIKTMKIYISDLETIFFHYAAYRFRREKNIIPIVLKTQYDFVPRLPEKVGAIFCMTVFEHLPDPLKIAKVLTKLLDENGLLIFDYIKTKGRGLDSKTSLRQRGKVIAFIKANFKIVHGEFDDSSEAKTIVARKL